MNGELALMAALAAVGGRWLREGPDSPPPDLLGANSSFQYVGSFTAAMPSRGFLKRNSTVASPEDWLVALSARRVTDLALLTDLSTGGPLSPHLASAFANSGTWALLATGGSAPTAWNITWDVGHKDAPDSRIWSLAANWAPGGGLRVPTASVAEGRDRLATALGRIRRFAEQDSGLETWATWFVKSERLLADPDPMPPYHGDLLPQDASLERRQLAAAVVQGWVFGGMGSWNDVWLADPAAQGEYERVGADLYAALLGGLPAAVNGA